MRFEDFRGAWQSALGEAGFFSLGPPTETLNLHFMERRHTTVLQPAGGQDAPPFHVTAKLEWAWDALKAARTATTEEDMLNELFDCDRARDMDTELPWLRVDVILRAYVSLDDPVPLPTVSAWRRWAREVSARLERIEPLLPPQTVREGIGGRVEMLGWKGNPEIKLKADEQGGLWLHGVELPGWQAIELPRCWDNSNRTDGGPEHQLGDLFSRVRAALQGWMEPLDHLQADRQR